MIHHLIRCNKKELKNGILSVTGVKSFEIYDISGKKVAYFKENATGVYNISNMPVGIYLLKSDKQIEKVAKIR